MDLLELTETEVKEIEQRFKDAKEPDRLKPDSCISDEWGYGYERFHLYVKFAGLKTFRAVNWKNGDTVKNKLHATIFTRVEAEKVYAEAKKLNPEHQWELRKI